MDKVVKNNSVQLMLWMASAVVVMALVASFMTFKFASAAEEANSIALSPSSTSLKLNAGDVVSGSMKVINEGDTSYSFSVYARPYGVTNELYNPDFTTQNTNANVYKWVQFDQAKYQAKPGQTIEVNYTIHVPSDAAPGGHYGVLFAETDADELAATGVARKNRVGNLLYVTVNGEHIEKGNLKGFVLPTWQTSAPMISSVRIENTGNVDFKAKVSTVAKDMFGRLKYTYTGEPAILPQTTRLAEMKWESAPNFGIFNVEQTAEFLNDKQQNSGLVLIAPKWAPIVIIIIIAAGAAYALLRRRNNRR
jgi:hypothetical protein